jgi:hypothetical protein
LTARVGGLDKSVRARLKRLSVAFAVELRLWILIETYVRGEMSPIQFCRLFKGESRSRVDKNFKVLAEHDWLRYVRSEKGNGRRGGEEHFYRVTKLPYIDTETWASLPYSIRTAFSWNTFKELGERVRETLEGANEAKAWRERPPRQPAGLSEPSNITRTPELSLVQVKLDQVGWERIYGAVNRRFECAHEEQKDAQLRAHHSGEKLLRACISQIVFERPTLQTKDVAYHLAEIKTEPLMPFPVRMSKALDEICLEIIDVANLQPVSVTSFHRKADGFSIDRIRTRFKSLEEAGWLTPACTKSGGRRRGGHEKFYRATAPLLRTNGAGAKIQDSVSRTEQWKLFEKLSAEIKEAMAAGTFDARDDRYLAWSFVHLDQQGFDKVLAEMNDLRAEVLAEERSARERLRESGEQPIPAIVALGAFISPEASGKVL